jgi:MerR family transcriptional regulator, redox-sensitive transcriptional activator SoxR
MASFSIGEVARICGLSPSAIRYYEAAGLVPKPMRVSRQRRYTQAGIGRLRLVQAAREAGFTIAETRRFVAGTGPPADRWRMLAKAKLAQIEAQAAELERMRQLLLSSFRCDCPGIEDCARIMAAKE